MQMAERFPNKRKKKLSPDHGLRQFLGSGGGDQPVPAKTAEKTENNSKGGPIDTTVGKSGIASAVPPPLMNMKKIVKITHYQISDEIFKESERSSCDNP